MEFYKSTDLYSQPGKDGKSTLIKKNILTKIDVPIDEIYYIEEVIGQSGKVLKNKCTIVVSQQQIPIIVNYNYNKLITLVHNMRKGKTSEIGFKYKNKNR